MANAFVQGTGLQSTGSVTTLAKAFASNVTAGNLIVVAIVGNHNPGAPTFTGTPPADTLGNTYTQLATYNGGNANTRIDLWYAKNITGGACTVTVTPSVSSIVSMGIAEVSGADATAPAGNSNNGTGSSGAPATGAVTIATAGEILFGVVTHEGATTAITPGGSFTQIFEDEDATEMPINFVYQLVSANTAVSWTTAGSQQWECLAGAFKAATAGLEQEGYRWRNDDGTEATATWKAAQDTGTTLPAGTPARLRVIVNCTGNPPPIRPRLRVRKVGDASYRNITPP